MRGLRLRIQRLWRQNRIRLPRRQPQTLHPGDRVQVGGRLFRVGESSTSCLEGGEQNRVKLVACDPGPSNCLQDEGMRAQITDHGLILRPSRGPEWVVGWTDVLVFPSSLGNQTSMPVEKSLDGQGRSRAGLNRPLGAP